MLKGFLKALRPPKVSNEMNYINEKMTWNTQDTNLSWYVPNANMYHTINGQITAISTLDHSATTLWANIIIITVKLTLYCYDRIVIVLKYILYIDKQSAIIQPVFAFCLVFFSFASQYLHKWYCVYVNKEIIFVIWTQNSKSTLNCWIMLHEATGTHSSVQSNLTSYKTKSHISARQIRTDENRRQHTSTMIKRVNHMIKIVNWKGRKQAYI